MLLKDRLKIDTLRIDQRQYVAVLLDDYCKVSGKKGKWPEVVELVGQIHAYLVKETGDWRVKDTALILNITPEYCSDSLQLARVLRQYPRIILITDRRVAIGIARRKDIKMALDDFCKQSIAWFESEIDRFGGRR